MKYKEYEENINDKRFILDERSFINALHLIKEIIDEDIDIELENNDDLLSFLNSPGKFTDNKDVIQKINDLKELLDIMGDVYYV